MLAAAAVALTPIVAWPSGAGLTAVMAAERPPGERSVEAVERPLGVELEEQTAWTRPGEDFAARLRLPAGHGGAVVMSRLYPALEEIDQVASTARREDLGRAIARLPDVAVAAGSSTVVVRLPVGSGPGRTELLPGVYPLVVELSVERGEAPDPLVTHVVVTAAAPPTRAVALVTRVDQPFRWTPEGGLELEGGSEVLGARLAPLAAHRDVPYTLVPTAGTVAALAEDGDGERTLRTLSELVPRSEVLNGPFARLPAGAWTGARLDEPLVEQFAAGEAALTAAFGGPPSGAAWLVSPTDDLVLLRWLAARGVGTFLVPRVGGGDEGGEVPSGLPVTPFHIAGVDPPHTALVMQPVTGLPPDDDDAGGPVAGAHRLLARLALPTLRDPGTGDGSTGRPVDGAPPAVLLLDDPATGARPVVDVLLGALSRPGPLRPVTVGALAPDLARFTDRPRWDLPAPVRPDLGGLAERLAEARSRLDSFVGTVGADDPVAGELRRAVLALGADYLTPAERSATVAALDAAIRRELGSVALDRDQPVTVTAHRADVPVAVHNRGTRPLEVALGVQSSDLEVLGPPVRRLRLEPGATLDVAVPVRVNRSGDFRVTVQVSSSDGRLLLASRTLTVRSTAISGVGVVLSIGALGFLFLWWARHVRRARRTRVPLLLPPAAESPRVEEPVR